MKFLIDADCPRSIGDRLVETGHEAYDIRDLRPGASDAEIYRLIKERSLILITRDLDFSNPLRFPLTSTCSVVLLRTLLLTPSRLFTLVEDVLRQIPEKELLGSRVIVRPGRYRIRRL